MFSKDSLKCLILFVSLTLFVLLLPIIPGTFSGLNEHPSDLIKMVNLNLEEPLLKEHDKADLKNDPELKAGHKLLTTITENSKSDFIASFSNDQQMIRNYAASAKNMATVILNPAAVTPGAFSPGERIIVEISEDKNYLVTVVATSSDHKAEIIRGKIEGSYFGFFHMCTTEGQTMAVLRVPEENQVYHIVYSNSGHYQLFEFAIDQFEQYEALPPLIPEEGQVYNLLIQERVERGSASDQPEKAGNPASPATIDVMVVYTPAARTWAGNTAAMNNVINQAMLRAQEALTNSNTGITMRLVHTAEVSYTESNINQSLYDIINGAVSNVHSMRNTYGADLVAFFPYLKNGSGLARLGWWNGYGEAESGYSAACVTGVASSYLAIHEMGHNFGAHHHKLQYRVVNNENIAQPGPHPLYPYAAGWRVLYNGTLFNTVMSYSDSYWFDHPSDPYRNINSVAIGYFSTPLLAFEGNSVYALGHIADGDNARMLRETKHGVAAFRPTVGSSYTLTVNIEPAGAREADAQWRVTSGPDTNWKNSGTTLGNLPVGNYTVTFKSISGWNAPPNSIVNVTANETQVLTATYTQQVTGLRSTPGLYDSRDGVFHRYENKPFRYGSRNSSWIPVVGNWNGSGVDDIGLYDSSDGVFHLKGSTPFRFGPRGSSWLPVSGDWNANSIASVGLYDSSDGVFHLQGIVPFRYGPRNSNWIPIAGDWNGDGFDYVGLYDPADGVFHLDGLEPFRYGPKNSSWIPIAGNWYGSDDDVGLYDQQDGVFHLAGYQPFRYGPRGSSWLPLAGQW